MKKFEYVIKDEMGIHARPAGLLVTEAKKFSSVCMIEKEGEYRDLTQVMLLLTFDIKKGETVSVCAEGEDEEEAILALRKIFEQNL